MPWTVAGSYRNSRGGIEEGGVRTTKGRVQSQDGNASASKSRSLKFGLVVPGSGNVSFDDLRAVFLKAEELGFDGGFMWDNMVNDVPTFESDAVWEPFVTLSALTEATSKIQIGVFAAAGRRHPAVVAKMTSCLDLISKGRVILAMISGGNYGARTEDPEIEEAIADSIRALWTAYGYGLSQPGEKIRMLREEIEIIRRLWTEESVSFQGENYRLDRAYINPKPLQEPHPPIWVGIMTGRKLMPRVAAQLADGVVIENNSDHAVREIIGAIRDELGNAGKDFEEFTVAREINISLGEEENVWLHSYRHRMDERRRRIFTRERFGELWQRTISGVPGQVVEQLKESMLDLGVTYILVKLPGVDRDFHNPDFAMMERFAHEVMAELR